MTTTATVLFVKATGHVLATVTRAGDPAVAPPAAELAGDGFPVRTATGRTVVGIASEALDTKVVPLLGDLLLKPQACGVSDDAAALLGGTAPTITLHADRLDVTVGAPVTAEEAVWAQVESGGAQDREREVLSGKIADGGTSVTLPRTFAGAAYDLLVLVAGHPPLLAVDQPPGP